MADNNEYDVLREACDIVKTEETKRFWEGYEAAVDAGDWKAAHDFMVWLNLF
jgi:hypothetical protein